MATLSPPALQPGDVLDGKYALRECIGQGGMGCVFLADQLALDRKVAIKVLHPELARCPAHARRIRDEAFAASRVTSPHCPIVFDCSALPDGGSYVVMSYVPGRSLARIIADEPIPLARALDLFDQILSALGAIHASGVIHADVKSDNFLVQSAHGRDHVTLIDFGLARFAASPASVDVEDGEAMVSGTPEYMAPEVVCGGAPIMASDLYGAGIILYELLTGATPFAGGTAVATMVRQAHDAVVPPSLQRPDRSIPPALDRVVLRALEKHPEARFADAATFARELRAAAGSAPVRAAKRQGPRPAFATRNVSVPPAPERIARGSDRARAPRAAPAVPGASWRTACSCSSDSREAFGSIRCGPISNSSRTSSASSCGSRPSMRRISGYRSTVVSSP